MDGLNTLTVWHQALFAASLRPRPFILETALSRYSDAHLHLLVLTERLFWTVSSLAQLTSVKQDASTI